MCGIYTYSARFCAIRTPLRPLPKGLEARGPVGKKKTNPKGSFTTKGPNWVHSLDGHDKPMGYQNRTFPLAVYGCIDTASRKLLWLRIWVTNSDPKVIGRWSNSPYIYKNKNWNGLSCPTTHLYFLINIVRFLSVKRFPTGVKPSKSTAQKKKKERQEKQQIGETKQYFAFCTYSKLESYF